MKMSEQELHSQLSAVLKHSAERIDEALCALRDSDDGKAEFEFAPLEAELSRHAAEALRQITIVICALHCYTQ